MVKLSVFIFVGFLFSFDLLAADAVINKHVEVEEKYFYAIIVSALASITALFVAFITVFSQKSLLKSSMDGNLAMQEARIVSEREHEFRVAKGRAVLDILSILSKIEFGFSTSSNFIKVTSADVDNLRKLFTDESLEIRRAIAISRMYCKDLVVHIRAMIVDMEVFWKSTENYMNSTSEDSRVIQRKEIHSAITELKSKLHKIYDMADKELVGLVMDS
jgi:hypothetical protein